MITSKNAQISLSRQCKLLSVSRSSVYYRPRKVKQEDLDLMRLIDEQYLKTPAYGSRSMTWSSKTGNFVKRPFLKAAVLQIPLDSNSQYENAVFGCYKTFR